MNFGDIIGVAALIVGLVGIPITFIVARRTRQRPDLRYAVDFEVILDPDDRLFDQGLFMTLGAEKIVCISRTRIAFWNKRGDTIRGSDILATDPLRLQFGGNDEPLQSRVISMSREQIGLTADELVDKSAVLINFDFLDAKDGGVLEVIHQGTAEPVVTGTIRGSTVRGIGSIPLSLDDLKRIGQSSPVRRWLDNKPSEKLNALLVAGAAFALLGIGLWFFFLTSGVTSSRLINPSRYNLHSINGQVAFTNAVSATKYYSQTDNSISWDWILYTTAIAGALCVIYGIYTQYAMIRRKIPGEITICRPSSDGHADSDDGYPDSDREQGESQQSAMAPESQGVSQQELNHPTGPG